MRLQRAINLVFPLNVGYICIVMQIKNAIISFVLLLAYTMGLAQSLAPHCNFNEVGNEISDQGIHTHLHHQHDKDNLKGHDHFVHADHFDEGIMDYFMCVLSESEHNDEIDHCFYFPNSTVDNSINWTVALQYITIYFDLNTKTQFELGYSAYNPELIISYFSPIIGDSHLRGPPSSSC